MGDRSSKRRWWAEADGGSGGEPEQTRPNENPAPSYVEGLDMLPCEECNAPGGHRRWLNVVADDEDYAENDADDPPPAEAEARPCSMKTPCSSAMTLRRRTFEWMGQRRRRRRRGDAFLIGIAGLRPASFVVALAAVACCLSGDLRFGPEAVLGVSTEFQHPHRCWTGTTTASHRRRVQRRWGLRSHLRPTPVGCHSLHDWRGGGGDGDSSAPSAYEDEHEGRAGRGEEGEDEEGEAEGGGLGLYPEESDSTAAAAATAMTAPTDGAAMGDGEESEMSMTRHSAAPKAARRNEGATNGGGSREDEGGNNSDASRPLRTLKKLQAMLDETDYATTTGTNGPLSGGNNWGSNTNVLDQRAGASDGRDPQRNLDHRTMERESRPQSDEHYTEVSDGRDASFRISGAQEGSRDHPPEKLWTSKDRSKYKKQQRRQRERELERRRRWERERYRHHQTSDDEGTDFTDDGLGYTLPNLPIYLSDGESGEFDPPQQQQPGARPSTAFAERQLQHGPQQPQQPQQQQQQQQQHQHHVPSHSHSQQAGPDQLPPMQHHPQMTLPQQQQQHGQGVPYQYPYPYQGYNYLPPPGLPPPEQGGASPPQQQQQQSHVPYPQSFHPQQHYSQQQQQQQQQPSAAHYGSGTAAASNHHYAAQYNAAWAASTGASPVDAREAPYAPPPQQQPHHHPQTQHILPTAHPDQGISGNGAQSRAALSASRGPQSGPDDVEQGSRRKKVVPREEDAKQEVEDAPTERGKGTKPNRSREDAGVDDALDEAAQTPFHGASEGKESRVTYGSSGVAASPVATPPEGLVGPPSPQFHSSYWQQMNPQQQEQAVIPYHRQRRAASLAEAGTNLSFDSLQKLVFSVMTVVLLSYCAVSPRTLPVVEYNRRFKLNLQIVSLIVITPLITFLSILDVKENDVNSLVHTFYTSFTMGYLFTFVGELILTTVLRLGVFAIWEPAVFRLTPEVPLPILPWVLRENNYRPRRITLFAADFVTSCVASSIFEEFIKLKVVQWSVRLPRNYQLKKRKKSTGKKIKKKKTTKTLELIPRNPGEEEVTNINSYVAHMLASSLGLKLADSIRRGLMYTKETDANKAFYAVCRGVFPIHELCGTLTALQLAKRDVLGVKMPLWKMLFPAVFIHGTANFRGMKPVFKWNSSTPWSEMQMSPLNLADDSTFFQIISKGFAKLMWVSILARVFGSCIKNYYMIGRQSIKRTTTFAANRSAFAAELAADELLKQKKDKK